MSYTIHVRINQTGVDWFVLVERLVFTNGGTWSEANGEHALKMNGSGTSGTLCLKNAEGEGVLFALGVHNYKRWCDIVTDLAPRDSAAQIHPAYYQDGSIPGSRTGMLWKQLDRIEKTDAKQRKFAINFWKEDDHSLWATIDIHA